MPIVKKIRRICRKCGKLFIPDTRFSRICKECYTQSKLKRKYGRQIRK